MSLKNARLAAAAHQLLVKAGVDPLIQRETVVAAKKDAAAAALARAKTFREVATLYVAAHETGWNNDKHRAQWTSTLETYCYPVLGNLAVADVQTQHVMQVLDPIWRSKTETATRVRSRIELVLDYAKVLGWRIGENPALWRGHIAALLPKPSKVRKVESHASLPWHDISNFMAQLRARGGLPARALELTILTAARSSEVLGARWLEVDLENAVWTVPAARMKSAREHRVPLSEAAIAVLHKLLPARDLKAGDWIFAGAREGRPLSNMSMAMLLRRMGHCDLTVHGFRSSFRTWVADATSHAGEVAEAALAHVRGDKGEAAYQRSDYLEKRRHMMVDWAIFCTCL